MADEVGLDEALDALRATPPEDFAAVAASARLDMTPTDRADLAAALHAVVADEEATAELARGRLLDVPGPDDFGLGLRAPATKPAAPKANTRARAPSDRRTNSPSAEPPSVSGGGRRRGAGPGTEPGLRRRFAYLRALRRRLTSPKRTSARWMRSKRSRAWVTSPARSKRSAKA